MDEETKKLPHRDGMTQPFRSMIPGDADVSTIAKPKRFVVRLVSEIKDELIKRMIDDQDLHTGIRSMTYRNISEENMRLSNEKVKAWLPWTDEQLALIDAPAIEGLVLCSGAAGTGKTAVAMALAGDIYLPNGYAVLFLAPANQPVDTMAAEYMKTFPNAAKPLRVYPPVGEKKAFDSLMSDREAEETAAKKFSAGGTRFRSFPNLLRPKAHHLREELLDARNLTVRQTPGDP